MTSLLQEETLDIKYNKHKQEFRDDPLMSFLLDSKEFFKKNRKLLSTGLTIVVVAIAGLSVFNLMSKSNEKKVQTEFGSAMISYENQQMAKAAEKFKLIAEKYSNTPQGLQSAYLLGGILFDQGQYDEAKKFYEIASKEKKEFIGAQASEGIAACYEAKGDVASALKYLEKALSDSRIAYRHGAIRWKIALLSKSSDVAKAKKICNEIISDTSAVEYHQPAENLLAVMENAG